MNVPYYILYFLCFVVLLLLLVFLGKDDKGNNAILDKKGIMSVLVALSIASGFILLVLFMGYGLVKIPLRTWTYSNLRI